VASTGRVVADAAAAPLLVFRFVHNNPKCIQVGDPHLLRVSEETPVSPSSRNKGRPLTTYVTSRFRDDALQAINLHIPRVIGSKPKVSRPV
jgi:hypothetical protein